MIRYLAPLLLLGVTTCGVEAVEAVGCTEVSERYTPGQRPPITGRTGPLMAGETMPVYRIRWPVPTANELEDRAMLMACALRDGLVSARPDALQEWSAAALEPEALLTRGAPFFDEEDLVVEYYEGSRQVILRQRLPRPDPPFEELEPGVHDSGIGMEGAQAVAGEFMERATDLGLLTEGAFVADQPTLAFEGTASFSSGLSWTTNFTLVYELQPAGVPVPLGSMELSVNRDGVIDRISIAEVDVEEVGQTVLAISEAEAAERWAEHVQALGHEGVEAFGSQDRAMYHPKSPDEDDPDPVFDWTTGPLWAGNVDCAATVVWDVGVWAMRLDDPDAGLIRLSPGRAVDPDGC